MQDSKKQTPDTGVVDSDATSKETLEDLEENEQSSDSQPKGDPASPRSYHPMGPKMIPARKQTMPARCEEPTSFRATEWGQAPS